MNHLLNDNVAALDQIGQLLRSLDDEIFARPHRACFGASVGAHLRHVLDHYHSFLRGLSVSAVDYETRQRDPRLETDRSHAGEMTVLISEKLLGLAGSNDSHLRVRLEGSPADSPADWGSSSVKRELEFLLSHTVHHCALMAITCHLQEVAVPEGFGLAPSTLRHRRALAVAAS